MLFYQKGNNSKPENAKGITPTFHLIGSKFNQVISSLIPISIPNIKALA